MRSRLGRRLGYTDRDQLRCFTGFGGVIDFFLKQRNEIATFQLSTKSASLLFLK